jgi:hypothetical protein
VSFGTITLCVASQRVLIVVVYFVIDSVRKLLDTHSYAAPGLTITLLSVRTNRTGLNFSVIIACSTAYSRISNSDQTPNIRLQCGIPFPCFYHNLKVFNMLIYVSRFPSSHSKMAGHESVSYFDLW